MDEIKTMTLEEIEERRKAIAEEIPTADAERLTAINAELDLIEERKREIKTQAEERAKTVEEVLNAPAAAPIVEERKEKKMTSREYRSTPEYIDAYVAYVKSGYDVKEFEKRMPEPLPGTGVVLKTENVEGGTIAVPTYIEDKINAAWENNEIMRRVRRTYLPGNVEVGVEVFAGPAVIHEEGGEAILSEDLEIAFVKLVPEYIKKMVKITHTALELTGTAFLDYLYDEIEYQIVKKAAKEVIAKVIASPYLETSPLTGAVLSTADIINAEGELAGDANPVLLISRADAAALKAAALGANYGYDPFDGIEVIYVDNVGSDYCALLVDLNAVQCNFPNGDQPRFIFDEFTEADKNVVRIIGRLQMACDLVATGKAVAIDSPSS